MIIKDFQIIVTKIFPLFYRRFFNRTCKRHSKPINYAVLSKKSFVRIKNTERIFLLNSFYKAPQIAATVKHILQLS